MFEKKPFQITKINVHFLEIMNIVIKQEKFKSEYYPLIFIDFFYYIYDKIILNKNLILFKTPSIIYLNLRIMLVSMT